MSDSPAGVLLAPKNSHVKKNVLVKFLQGVADNLKLRKWRHAVSNCKPCGDGGRQCGRGHLLERLSVSLVVRRIRFRLCKASKLDTYDVPEYDDPKSAHGPPAEQTRRSPKADDVRTDPRLIRVAWESADDCDSRTITPVRIVIELDTGNHPIDELSFEGAERLRFRDKPVW